MDISRELGINKQSFYNWKMKYAGMSGEHLRHLEQLQEEIVRLNKCMPMCLWKQNAQRCSFKKVVGTRDRHTVVTYLVQNHQVVLPWPVELLGSLNRNIIIVLAP